MDKNDVGAGYIALKIGDTLQAEDQRYVNFCWIPVPKSRIGAKIQRMHWPMRRLDPNSSVGKAPIPLISGAKKGLFSPVLEGPKGSSIFHRDFRAMEEKIHGTLASMGLLHPLPKPFTPNKYTRDLVALDGRKVPVDVYCVLAAFPTGSSAIDHAVKKLLAPGQRGQKDRLQDLKEARASLDRAIQMEGG